ncbi:uncharacterized protein DMAD_02486 [Drosophila madeirensis]|uniref:non-specific serine/threonine protein kinase n=1 Tax=Drosophila madeirensis TaxID=30013 RepID=A0AAU9G5H3_DROMD
MGKRLPLERPPTDRNIRKRKRAVAKEASDSVTEKCQRLSAATKGNGHAFHENDDEDSSSSGSAGGVKVSEDALVLRTPQAQNLQLAGASFVSDQNHSNSTESPRPVYTLRPSVVNGTILRDVLSKAWRLGRPIGKGNFGEIFLASDDTVCPVSSERAKYVVKIEPHSNGPLFVEIHCLINTSDSLTKKITDDHADASSMSARRQNISNGPPSGIPSYIASGTHYFGDARYRFLVLPRFDRDLHSLIKNSRVEQKCLLVIAIHIINVLEHLHDKGYCHNDIKAQNLMISKCKYLKQQTVPTGKGKGAKNEGYDEHYDEKQQTTDSGNSSEQDTTDDVVKFSDGDDDYFMKNKKFSFKHIVDVAEEDDEDEDFDDGATSNSNNSNSQDTYHTPLNKNNGSMRKTNIQFSGSNPVRSCRREKRNSMYEEMVKSHYLRPTKRVSYREDFNEEKDDQSPVTSDNDSEEFFPPSARRSTTAVGKRGRPAQATPCTLSKCSITTRATRHQSKLKREINEGSKRTARCQQADNQYHAEYQLLPAEEERVFLIDFGLASKYQDRGVHRPFIMDQRRAHDGTLEFTSRDAHLGAHSRRSDLECLGYNLVYWSEGYLPWKDVAQQQQQEKVHRAKELFMTDVSEMLRQFYGKQVPKYLGEFLKQIGQLAYQERPNYERYRNIFKREFQLLGYDPSQMRLNSEEILRTRGLVKDEIGGNKCDIFELNNKISTNVMRNSTLSTPFQEHSITNRVSPKNLRSKSSKKNVKKKFSWAEVISQDPDQIARERATKEFEREETICPLQMRLPKRYEGRPTYAILAVEQSRRDKGLVVQEHNEGECNDGVDAVTNEQEEEDNDEAESTDGEYAEQVTSDESDYSDHSNEAVRRNVRGGAHSKRSNTKQSQTHEQKPNRGAARSVKNVPAAKFATGAVSKSRSTPLSSVASNKRGCATRKENSTVASATTEVERKLKSMQSPEDRPKQRRTRRRLYKTESKIGPHDVENNSSLLEVEGLYSEYDDENIYIKGRSVNSSRHSRKLLRGK